jgi:type I restriction enzyme R subunit
MRYKELFSGKSGSGGDDVPYDIDGYLTTIDTGKIDSDYMNSRFEKFFKLLQTEGVDAEDLKNAEAELHKTFATLTQEEQKYADVFLHDIQSGDVKPEKGKTLRDYITDYMGKAHDDKIHRFAKTFGFDEEMLRVLMSQNVNAANINEYGRLDALKNSVKNTSAAARYFENTSGRKLSIPKVKIKLDDYLRKFILEGGFDLE